MKEWALKRRMISHILLIATMVLGTAALPTASVQAAGPVSLTTLGTPYTQNFDTLPASGSATWTNNSTIPGWFHARTGTGTTVVANDGSSNAGNLYSYGTGTATDRALGSIGSGNAAVGNLFWGVRLSNDTGATITSLDISYTGEQWRNSAAAAQTVTFSYLVGSPSVTGSLAEFQSAGVAVSALDLTSPITGGTAGALNGNLAANRVTLSFSITGLSIPNGTEIMLRWADPDHTGADHGLAIDDFSVTPQGGIVTPTLNISDVTSSEGDPPGTTTFTFAVTLTSPAGAGGVTFDIATADGTAQDGNPGTEDNDYVAQSLTGQTIASGSTGPYNFSVTVNRDAAVEPDETFFVNVTNITGANAGDTQGQGTITNDDISLSKIHDVQGNGAATPIPGATVAVEGVVIGDYQGSSQLQGFFLQEEDADVDADPATSEGIFVFCSSCPTGVAEGQRVRVTGTVSEFNNMTEITASTAGSVVVTDAGNHLAEATPTPIDLPVVGDINTFYEAREGMLVTFVDTLTVSDYFELFRFGQVELFEGGRPRQFTEASPPSVAGYTAHLDDLDRRRVILDDDNNTPNAPLTLPDGSQFVYHPRANGGFSVGTQGIDFFRGGDLVNGLTGVLHWSFAGTGSADAWRIRPTNARPAAFTVANPRPATPPAVGGAIKAVGMNLLNYFTTIDTTSSSSSGPCGPTGTLDCRGADSVAELNRQRERASIIICSLNADVYAFMELENTTPTNTITDLVGAVNARCGGANPYTFVNTGGTLGTDAIRVAIIYRTGILSPVGAPLVDLDPVHNRPPTAQTFDVIDPANPAFGKRFTVIANHLKSKGCPGTGADADAGDGQSCFNGTRTSQANRLLTWISGTVLPAAGDPDILLLGDFNSYAQEDPVTTLTGGGYTDLASTLLGPSSYSYLFDGQLGHLDYAFASPSLASQVTGIGNWHINADEVPLFDYNDEVLDSPGEASFEEKPDGSALVPPRVVFEPASPYRASDHDPVIVGLFHIADLSVSKVDTPDPVSAGTNLTYTITLTNTGPDLADSVVLSDTLPAGTTFVSLASPGGWSCATPAVGAGGTVSCSVANMLVGSAVFTLTVQVGANVANGTTLSNTATVSSTTGDPTPGDQNATATTTVATSADLSVSKVDTPDPVQAGTNLSYTITVTNTGPSSAASVVLVDTLPTGTTFASLASPGGWSCTTPAVGAGGTISCSSANMPVGSAIFTLTVQVDANVAAGTVLSNTANASSATSDPTPGDQSATATTTVATLADLSVSKVDTPDPVSAGGNLTYTITVANTGPSSAASVVLVDTLPTGTTFASLASPGGWSCTTPAVGAGGTISCNSANMLVGSAVFTLTVQVNANVPHGSTLSNTATVASTTSDPNPGDESATATTIVIDTIAPMVTINQAAGQADPTSSSPISFTVVFSESVTGFTSTDVSLGGTANPTTAVVTEITPMNGTTYNVAVSGMTTSGTVTATIAAGAVTDLAGNPNTASTSIDNTVTFNLVVPVVTGLVRAGASPTKAATVAFNVSFSEVVNGVDANDFSLANNGVTGASIASVIGSGTTYTVTVNTGSGSGTIGLNLVDNDTIVDANSTPLGGKGAGNGNFTGPVYTIDKTAPQASSLVVGNITTGGGTTHSFTVVFSDNLAIDIASLDSSDIRVTGPGGFNQLATFVSVTPASNGAPRTATYSINASGGSWDNADNGVYTVALQANQVRDGVGNLATARTLGTFSVNIGASLYKVFLPTVQEAGTPDLVVTSISLVPSKSTFAAGEGVEVRVTVTNPGSATAGGFWLDLSINPSSPPTAANQIWNERCGLTPCYGMAWEVVGGLAPGQSITLSSLKLPAGYSVWPGYFAAGTTDLYAYVDSYNPGVVAGSVAESDETNNRAELHGLSVAGPNPALRGMGVGRWGLGVQQRR